jgi:subtilase family serine protease
MRRILIRTLALAAVVGALVLMGFVNVAAATTNTTTTVDLYYQPQVSWMQASPDTVVPLDVPLCHTVNKAVPGSPLIICYAPNFIRTAYNFPTSSSMDGTGQTIVIVDAYGSPTIANDLKVFDRTFGLPDPNFTILCPTGCPPTLTAGPHLPTSWAVETSLDVEWAHAMAPGANIVLVVASSNSGNVLNTAETMAMPMFPGSVMSQSFGFPELAAVGNNGQVVQADANYQMAASLGITVLASAGDFGATNGATVQNALFPSSDPLVTSIGGTMGNPFPGGLATFTGTCSIGPRPGFPTGCTPTGYGGEQVWNEVWDGIAGGGAQSLLFSTPSYQSGLGLSMRGTPDVSYNAAVDGGVLVYATFTGAPTWFIVGGTSAGSPQWASIFAIANQIRAGEGKGPLGFVNPTLYALSASQKANDFHDITMGNNMLDGTLSGNAATTGWDLASGWGTPNVSNLVTDLG